MIIKVCGITNPADARVAEQAGATHLGFIFYPRSPRYVPPEDVAAIESHVPRVGVFVNATPAEVERIAGLARLDVAQLHGGQAERLPRWRVYNVDEGFNAAALDPQCDAWLLDAPAPDTHGGTGRTFDWTRIPPLGKPWILAGGLDGSNVAEAVRIARPAGVDASSRLESAPGRKDAAKVVAFVRAARAAFKQLAATGAPPLSS